ncbi:MAG: NTP transferase domain-containing protein [Gemmatimonadota bacterium]|nr:NTP transferase domain-containing protein [Gemmatimonadota bacterium]
MARRLTTVSFPGLVLAAGSSVRMPGRSKLTRAWSDTTVLGAVLGRAVEANLQPLFVACAGSREGMPPDLPFTLVPVSGPEVGRATSLAAGLSAMPEGPVLVLLGDEPGVRSVNILALIAAWDPSAADMARIRYADRSGHPVLLGSSARSRAEELTGDAPIWATLLSEGFVPFELAVDEPAPIDVDSPSDLRRARRKLSTGRGRA